MPSKFEPCGLPQMYALRYLTIPIVRGIGGLDESITDYDPTTKKGLGFKFALDGKLNHAILRANKWYQQGDNARQPLLKNASHADFS